MAVFLMVSTDPAGTVTHTIWQAWYFQWATLWEVGTYILVKHHTDISTCEGLKFQIEFLE